MTVLLKTSAIDVGIDGDIGKSFLSHYLSRFASFSFYKSGTFNIISSQDRGACSETVRISN